MLIEDARKKVTVVRPTHEGKWEVVVTTYGEDAEWESEWVVWWASTGEGLHLEHPDWWPLGDNNPQRPSLTEYAA